MTLDREERERLRHLIGTAVDVVAIHSGVAAEETDIQADVLGLLDRIEDLEEALHASRLRREELEALRDELNGLFVEENDRAEGYRKAAIILRDFVQFWESDACNAEGCGNRARKDSPHCWRHR